MRLIALFIILLTGCSTLEFNPKSDYLIVLKFHDNLHELQKVCSQSANGCHIKKGNIHYINAIKSRCVLDHELDHVFYGSFHKYPVQCIVRAE